MPTFCKNLLMKGNRKLHFSLTKALGKELKLNFIFKVLLFITIINQPNKSKAR
jgi:hypothetical protein